MNQSQHMNQEDKHLFHNLFLPEEFTITPIRGYREWAFIVPDVRLQSSWDKSIWPVDGPHIATCSVGCNSVPSDWKGNHAGAGCGLYAHHHPRSVKPGFGAGGMAYMSGNYPKYWGVVETYGKCKVVWHAVGFRASNLRVLALADTGKRSRQVANVYGVPCLAPRDLVIEFPPSVSWSPILR